MYINLFIFFVYFSLLSPCKEDDYKCCTHFHLLMFLWDYSKRWQWIQHSLLSSTLLMKLGQKTTTNTPCPCLFFFLALQKKWRTSPLVVIFYNSRFFLKKHIEAHKRTTSLVVHHCPLQPKKKNLDVGFSWVAGDNNEPPNSSSFLNFLFLTCRRRRQAERLIVVFFFPHLQKMTMSWDPDSSSSLIIFL
jgi:hypothetical protein